MLCALFLSFVEAKSKYIDKDDEDRPYEFGFSIENYQHRHEKKDEKGIIMGEFGFVTADGIYHVTVYATDENGDFKILSMKNVRVGPSPFGTTKKSSESSTSTMSSIYPTVVDSKPKFQQKLTSPEVTTSKFQQKLTSPEVTTPKFQQKQALTEVTTPKTSPVAACSHCNIPEPVTFNYDNSVNLGANNAPRLGNNNPSPAKPGPYSNSLGDKTQTSDSPERQMNLALQGINQQPGGNPQSPSVNLESPLQNQGLNLGYPTSPGNYAQNQRSNPAKLGQPHSNGLGDKTQTADSPETQINPDLLGINQQSGGNPQSPSVNLGSPLQNQGLNLGYPTSPGNYPQNQRSYPAKPVLDPVSSSSYPQKPVLTSAIMKTLTDAYPIPESGQKPGLPEGLSAQDMLGLLYRFNYTVGFHGHQEVGYGNGDKEGKYFVNNRDGVGRKVEYLANEFGYQPNITLYDLKEEDTPKEETEKNYGLKGYEFKWFNQIGN